MTQPHGAPPKPSANGKRICLKDLAKAKHLPADFLRDLGLTDLPEGGVAIPYYDETDQEIIVKRRSACSAGEGYKPPYGWPKGRPLAAYGQWKLDEANRAGFCIIVEGESDCWALWYHKLPALGLPGSSTAKTLEIEYVAALQKVYIVREPDQGGETFVKLVVERLRKIGFQGQAFELRMPKGVKDPAELHGRHAAQPKRFLAEIETAIKASLPLEINDPSAGRNGHAEDEVSGLATTCLATIRPEPVRFLIPGHIPLGKLVLFAGDGGHGKSALTLGITACLTPAGPVSA